MITETFIQQTLAQPINSLPYFVGRQLVALFPDKGIIAGEAYAFDVEAYARAGYCQAVPNPRLYNRILTGYDHVEQRLEQELEVGVRDVEWQEQMLQVLEIYTKDGADNYYWIIADNRAIAEAFFETVYLWNTEIRAEVLVFEDGGWCKSEDLYESLQRITLDSLILKDDLKEQIIADLARFFRAQETYRRYGIPWKRGVLLIGPPGNGKTHMVKALINYLQQPCLYVKSFASRHGPDESSIRTIFTRARHTTPCLLVFEDLDALVTNTNRSFFLNEMDGFADNDGIVVLATTNHPERLDPAIIERPSRFDRKYHFELPDMAERHAYVVLWNTRLQAEMQLAPAAMLTVAEQTRGFSFAYLKELFVSAMMSWIDQTERSEAGTMEQVLSEQIALLHQHMDSSVPMGFVRG